MDTPKEWQIRRWIGGTETAMNLNMGLRPSASIAYAKSGQAPDRKWTRIIGAGLLFSFMHLLLCIVTEISGEKLGYLAWHWWFPLTESTSFPDWLYNILYGWPRLGDIYWDFIMIGSVVYFVKGALVAWGIFEVRQRLSRS